MLALLDKDGPATVACRTNHAVRRTRRLVSTTMPSPVHALTSPASTHAVREHVVGDGWDNHDDELIQVYSRGGVVIVE